MSRLRNLNVIGVSGIAGAFGLAMAIAAASPHGTAGIEPWKTISVAGKVESQAPGTPHAADWVAIRRGAEVSPLTQVRTSSRSRATLTRQGDLILVAANSSVVLPDRQPDGTTVVLQEYGHAIYKVAPRTGGGHFEVRTPLLVAGVKGTRFSVIQEEHRVAVSVLEGVVEVRSAMTGETTDLTAGMVAVVDDAMNRIEVHSKAERNQPARGNRERAPGGRDKTVQTVSDDSLSETLRTSEKLAACLIETDDSLALLDKEEDQDLWADLLEEPVVDRTTTTLLDQTTTRLDPLRSDPKSDPSLITKLITMVGGR